MYHGYLIRYIDEGGTPKTAFVVWGEDIDLSNEFDGYIMQNIDGNMTSVYKAFWNTAQAWLEDDETSGGGDEDQEGDVVLTGLRLYSSKIESVYLTCDGTKKINSPDVTSLVKTHLEKWNPVDPSDTQLLGSDPKVFVYFWRGLFEEIAQVHVGDTIDPHETHKYEQSIQYPYMKKSITIENHNNSSLKHSNGDLITDWPCWSNNNTGMWTGLVVDFNTHPDGKFVSVKYGSHLKAIDYSGTSKICLFENPENHIKDCGGGIYS